MSWLDDILAQAKGFLPDVPNMMPATQKAADDAGVGRYIGKAVTPDELTGAGIPKEDAADVAEPMNIARLQASKMGDIYKPKPMDFLSGLATVLSESSIPAAYAQNNKSYGEAMIGKTLGAQRIAQNQALEQAARSNAESFAKMGAEGGQKTAEQHIANRIQERQQAKMQMRNIMATALAQDPDGKLGVRDEALRQVAQLGKMNGIDPGEFFQQAGIANPLAGGPSAASPVAPQGAPTAVPAGPGNPAGIPPVLQGGFGRAPQPGAPAPAPTSSPGAPGTPTTGAAPAAPGPAPAPQGSGVPTSAEDMLAQAQRKRALASVAKAGGFDSTGLDKEAEALEQSGLGIASAGPKKQAEDLAALQVARAKSLPDDASKIQSMDEKLRMVNDVIDKLMPNGQLSEGLKANLGDGTLRGLWSRLPNSPGGEAADAWAKLQQLTSQEAFQGYSDVRNESKTGGGFRLTQSELPMLANLTATLSDKQSPEAMADQLKKIKYHIQQERLNNYRAFDMTYGTNTAKAIEDENKARAEAGKPKSVIKPNEVHAWDPNTGTVSPITGTAAPGAAAAPAKDEPKTFEKGTRENPLPDGKNAKSQQYFWKGNKLMQKRGWNMYEVQ